MEEQNAGELGPLVKTTPKFYVTVAVLLGVTAWAVYAYTWQWNQGLGVTGMNAPAYWGIYIVNFVYLIGLSAGGVIVASLAYVFRLHAYRPIARIAELLAIICLILAVTFVTLDIGRPERFLNLIIYAQPGSPLIWDFVVIFAYLGICLIYGYLGTRQDIVTCMNRIPRRRRIYRLLALGYVDVSPKALEKDERILQVVAFIALPLAIALHSITAWILGLMKAQPGWHSALLAPLFVVSAIVSGLALVIVVSVLARRFLNLHIEDKIFLNLGRILVWLIPIDFYFAFAEIITIQFGREPGKITILEDIMFGTYSWAFWTEMIVGLLIPFLILVNPKTRTPRRIAIAAALVAFGVFFKRIDIVLPSLTFRWLPFPAGSYAPTWVEYSLIAGVYAFGALLFLLFSKLFPLVELKEKVPTAETIVQEGPEQAPA